MACINLLTGCGGPQSLDFVITTYSYPLPVSVPAPKYAHVHFILHRAHNTCILNAANLIKVGWVWTQVAGSKMNINLKHLAI